MSELEIAQHVLFTLQQAENAAPQAALPMLKRLIGLVNGGGAQPFEVEEARSSAFMAICEYAKALHRGQPAERLWPMALKAVENWLALAGQSARRASAQLAPSAAGWALTANPSMQ